MEKKTFLFLIYSLSNGGAERVVSVLTSQIALIGHNVHLGLFKKSDDDYELNENVVVHTLNEGMDGNKLKNSFCRIRQMRNLIKNTKPDYIIALMGTVLIESRIASIGIKSKYISAVRNDPAQKLQGEEKYRQMMLVTNYLSDAIWVQNETQKKFYPKFLHKKIFVVANSVNPLFVQNKHPNKGSISKIITAGRLTDQKNHEMLIDAVANVHRKHPHVELFIYGIGPMEDFLNEKIVKEGHSSYVHLCGRSHNMVSTLQENDLFVLSSRFEGMPNALLEAMTLGMPCISTDCRTGPSEMIVNYKNGLLVPEADMLALANAIEYMVVHSDEAHCMGNEARVFGCSQCNVEFIAKQFVEKCDMKYY